MLKIHVEGYQLYDEEKNRFYDIEGGTFSIEYSLFSIYKWESKWKKPYFNTKEKTVDESIDFIRCMTLEEGIDPLLYYNIKEDDLRRINYYMNDPVTATTFGKPTGPVDRSIKTAEVFYYLMTVYNIPFECDKWNFNRLLALIKTCNIENAPKKPMTKKEIYAQNREINERNKRRFHSKG